MQGYGWLRDYHSIIYIRMLCTIPVSATQHTCERVIRDCQLVHHSITKKKKGFCPHSVRAVPTTHLRSPTEFLRPDASDDLRCRRTTSLRDGYDVSINPRGGGLIMRCPVLCWQTRNNIYLVAKRATTENNSRKRTSPCPHRNKAAGPIMTNATYRRGRLARTRVTRGRGRGCCRGTRRTRCWAGVSGQRRDPSVCCWCAAGWAARACPDWWVGDHMMSL
jgi:hypothetical protein